jgi:hypothetical protein
MKNQHGLNEEKTIRKKNDLSIESSEVTHVVSLDTINLSVRLWREWRKESEEGSFSII